MKNNRKLQKVTMAASVVVMSVGLFQSFDASAEMTGSGVCCQDFDETCYHRDEQMTFGDSVWKQGATTCTI